MSNRIHALAQQLTGKATLDECSTDELRHIVKRHPYFAPAQFLLLQKFRQLNSEETIEQQKKAVLFYHDPLLFDYFISSNKFYVDELSLVHKKEISSSSKEESFTQDDFIDNPGNGAVEFEEGTPGGNDSFETNEFAADVVELSSSVEAPQTNNIPESFEGPTTPDSLIETAENEIIEVEEEPASANNSIQVNDPVIDASGPTENSNATPLVEISEPNNLESFAESSTVNKEIEFGEEKFTDEIKKSGQDEIRNEIFLITDNKESSLSPLANEELVFEPYYTVDYFASQGIKISQEELPKDKLGKQLKSFTEWLKTMKRLPATQITAAVEASAEKKVETMADRSISQSDVFTEAMAEVWAKQGNKEKAMEIYNKLSLLDPSKTAYFAAKIENLKEALT